MSEHEITCNFSNEGTRNDVRMRVVEKFSEEEPGTGSGENASKYIYYVEQLKSGDRVYLKRPANLHNGFDFVVCVENVNYAEQDKRVRNYPKHDDIGKDLQDKKDENPEMYRLLYELLFKVYKCHNIDETCMEHISFTTGFTVDHILKVIKWLFIEQDIRYWNYSGRDMTWGLVPPTE